MQPTPASTPKKRAATAETESDRELKAYIYQQLAELQPYLFADSQLAVSVQQVVSKKKDAAADLQDNLESNLESNEDPRPGDYVVRLTATLENPIERGKLTSEGHGASVYDAFRAAKSTMMEQLVQLQNATVDQADRDEEVRSYLDGSRTLH